MGGGDFERAEGLLRSGRYDKAIDQFRALLSRSPEHPELRGRVAEAYRLAGKSERAFHHFLKAARLYGRENDLMNSVRMLEAANQISPNEPDVLYRLAERLKKLGRPTLKPILRNLVKAARAPGDRRRLWALEELAVICPQELEVQVERARSLTEVGRASEAAELWHTLVPLLIDQGVDVSAWIEQAGAANPEEPETAAIFARLLLRVQKPRQALALLLPFYERFPDAIPILEALVMAVTSVDAKDKIVPAQLELLRARTRKGHRGEALAQVKALLETSVGDTRVLEVCAHTCLSFGLSGEATRLWYKLARLYDRHAMGSDRDRALLRIFELRPDHEGALALGARVLRTNGRPQEAAKLETRLEEVQTRSNHELPALSSVAKAGEATAEVPEHQESRAKDTSLQSETDVLAAVLDEATSTDFLRTRETSATTRPGSHSVDVRALQPAKNRLDEEETGKVEIYSARAQPPSFHRPAGVPVETFSAAHQSEHLLVSEYATHDVDLLSGDFDALLCELADEEATAVEIKALSASADDQPPQPSTEFVNDLIRESDDDELE